MSSLTGLTFDMFAQSLIFISALVGISIGAFKESGSLFFIIGFITAILYLLLSNLSLLISAIASREKLNIENANNRKINVEESRINPNQSKRHLVFNRFRLIITEYLKTPNQMLFFLFFSVLDMAKIPSPMFFEREVSYLMIYILFLFFIILGVFLFKVFLTAKEKETDRLFARLK